jgi:hypothetical protein
MVDGQGQDCQFCFFERDYMNLDKKGQDNLLTFWDGVMKNALE